MIAQLSQHRRMEVSLRKARALQLRFSQSLASRRQQSNAWVMAGTFASIEPRPWQVCRTPDSGCGCCGAANWRSGPRPCENVSRFAGGCAVGESYGDFAGPGGQIAETSSWSALSFLWPQTKGRSGWAELAYANIASINSLTPRIAITRFMLKASTFSAISVATLGSRFVRKCVAPIQHLIVPNGCSAV
jgi:hypothetical protein